MLARNLYRKENSKTKMKESFEEDVWEKLLESVETGIKYLTRVFNFIILVTPARVLKLKSRNAFYSSWKENVLFHLDVCFYVIKKSHKFSYLHRRHARNANDNCVFAGSVSFKW